MLLPNGSLKKIIKKPKPFEPYWVSTKNESNGNFVENNLVGQDKLQQLKSGELKNFSPRLLNWVEPYTISGMVKTLFYSEVNSGLSVGDRVFIVNGNYDSNELIRIDKYKRGRDGYKILYIDRCAIVLDIDYTGVLPYNEYNQDDFVNVYYIRNRQDFQHANRQITTKNGIFDYKFNPYNNNVIYADQDYFSETGWGENLGLTGSPGFYVKNGTYSWINITPQFISGSFSIALSATYSTNKIKIHNYTFTYSIGPSVVEFKEDYVYIWDMAPEPDGVAGTYSTWINDPRYNRAIITKGNFRDGNFKGTWNTGLYGTSNKRIKWDQETAIWNNGTMLNVRWVNGTINSLYTLPESWIAEFDEFGLPSQRIVGPDNNGKGYNFIISSELLNSTIVNGTIIDSTIGSTPTYSLIENYLLSSTITYDNQIQQASFDGCRFLGGYVSNAELKNTRAINTFFTNIKSINSNYKLSIIKDSVYLSDEIIKIIGYDEFNYNLIPTTFGPSHKVYKFYISESSYKRLKLRDRFYFKGLKFNNNLNYPLNFFDKRFRVSSWSEYLDDLSPTYSFYKRGVECGAFLSSPSDNRYLYNTFATSSSLLSDTIIVGTSSNNKYSVDVVFSLYDKSSVFVNGLSFNRDLSVTGTASPTMSILLGNILDVNNACILDSDFESGLFETSNWESGAHMNYNNDVNMTIDSSFGKYYAITIATPSQSLIINTNHDQFYVEAGENCLSTDNIVYLSAVDYDTSGRIDSFTISATGSGYFDGIGLTTSGGSGNGLIIDITTISGAVDTVTLTYSGLGYSVGDSLIINGGLNDATLTVLSITGSMTRLPDTYKITSNVSGILTLKEIVTGSQSIIESLLPNGLSYTKDAHNRWGYIYKAKFNNSRIKSGIFRRSYITKSLIQNEDYDETDKDFTNLEMIRSLLITDSIFSNTQNILSLATYMNSSFVKGNEIHFGGIVYNSIWNGLSFTKGVFKQGRWLNGIFKNGIFYNSKSFNNSATALYPYFYTERNKNYWTEGYTDAIIANDRYSWQDGIFMNGEFYKSDWENGEFKNGKFYFSNFYGGTISGGVIGEDSIPTSDTQIFNATISYTTVENAKFYAIDTSYYELTPAKIFWYDGIFNNGIFGSDMLQPTWNEAIWYDGIFNNGQFISNARWKDGVFNGGIFISGFGWTMSSSSIITDYTWETGIFNGGEFGNAETATNSIWYSGVFTGGVFKGRVWNSGLVTGGDFFGSGMTATGGLSSSNASIFVDTFTSSFYGYWRNGKVSKVIDVFLPNQTLTSTNYIPQTPLHKMQNILWVDGTFSHTNFEIKNSVWLSGAFEKGKMTNSSFNPFVKRNGDILPSFNLDDTQCYWENGNFDGGDFYISEFQNGRFIIGTAYGMIFKNGVSNYMNAFNVFWEDGLWRNGNWYGSYFKYDSSITDDFTLQIIYRGMSWSGSDECHLWNIFEDLQDNAAIIVTASASTVETSD